jgi:hypothetical protein
MTCCTTWPSGFCATAAPSGAQPCPVTKPFNKSIGYEVRYGLLVCEPAMKPWLLARGQSEEPKQSVSDAPHVVVAVSPPKPPQVSRFVGFASEVVFSTCGRSRLHCRAQVVPAPMEVSPTHPPILSPAGASRVRRNSAGLETVVSGVSSPANSASSRSSGAGSSSALPVDRKGDIRSPISPARVKALLRSGPVSRNAKCCNGFGCTTMFP